MKTTIVIALALMLSACATAPSPGEQESQPKIAASSRPAPQKDLPEPSTVYYTGTVQVSSADGSSIGAQPALVKREIRPSEGLIIETVLDEGQMRVTTLTQKNNTNIFEATDEDNSFGGTVTFVPNPWKPMNWVYDLKMSDGSGGIQGTATVMPNGVTTIKSFVGPDGERQAQIIDKLTVVTPEEYEAALPQ